MVEYDKLNFNVVISPFDSRDYQLQHLNIPTMANFPEEFHLDTSKFIDPDQGIINNCGGQSFACALFVDDYKNTGTIEPYSIGWAYGNRNPATDYMGQGIVIREMLEHGRLEGVPYAKDFPIVKEMPDMYYAVQSVKSNLLTKAAEHKISAYARVNTIAEMKTALMTLGVVIITVPIYQSYYHIINGVLPNPTDEELKTNPQATHEMVLVGWMPDGKLELIDWDGGRNGVKGKKYISPTFPILEAFSITKNTTVITKPDPTTELQQSIMCLQYDLNLDYNARISQNGIDDVDTYNALNGIKGLLVKGSRSHVVLWLKQRLIRWGYLKDIGIDGMLFDESLFQAITNLQKNWGRPTDGVLRIETWSIFLNNL